MHCASLLCLIFASSACTHGRVHVQNVRDFPQTNFNSKINSSFLLNKHSDTRLFFQVFATNSQITIKNIFEEENKFDSGTIFFWRIVPYWMYFDQGQDFKLTTVLSEKVQYSCNQATKNSLNEAILLMSINEALLSR